ncbi:CubicO group peptidase (beta-lactamase class C family) [Streptosporangium becharense]|uniref:CubicO group peptidase (Beta-lactamase class C family) n=1 Tax=Streptosporangium becharense TaxID=1816182 RepID=A0A7W9IAZ5_9ACTN|nr:serine hydrolase domain-containing protein [Streptosporangium becharense]MBB2910715.1 CubicO group peptidase (beta-lactamase class C family) [Streptosporangium becharense]MBB5817410.1 CubicO group peptidase (beta-lactamase class C family) [Streptosporangium becharense]
MDLERVKREVSSLVSPHDPGLAVGVYVDGAAVLTVAQGAACVEFDVPVDERTRFDIASMSKQFTAACVLLLERDGKLTLDDDVRVHVPELSLETPVTLRQCLQHTGGLPEWYMLQALTGVPLAEMTEQRLLEVLAGIRRTTFAPGTNFSYSNTGYVLAAVVVGRVAGSSLAEFARQRLFEPLGMADSVFRDDASVPLERLAYGYANAKGEPRRADTEESAVGDGGLVTSVADLAPWFGFLADGRVLGADLRERLLERGVLADGTVEPYALGIYHGENWFGHAGGMHGYQSNLLYLPDPGVGITVLTNQTAVDPVKLSHRLARLLLGREEPPKPGPGTPAPPERLHWHDPMGDGTLTLEPTAEGIAIKDIGVFTAGADGRWHGTGDAEGAWLEIDGDRLLLRVGPISRPPVAFDTAEPPSDAPMPDGVFHSRELGVDATVSGGEVSIGRELKLHPVPAPGGAWEAGLFTFRMHEGDLLVSGGGLRRMRFEGTRG